MYENGTFFPSISGHYVCCLELPDQDNEKVVIVMDGVCQDEWQWRGQLRKCGRSDLYHLLPSPTSIDMCCFIDFITKIWWVCIVCDVHAVLCGAVGYSIPFCT